MSTVKRHRGGRPTKLVPEVVERIVSATKLGRPVHIAAQYAGVSER
ncbi:hypothetical protein AB0G73_31970 [Streptomyces sp. NPDC020719]